jgi:hypothetical protein
MNNTENALELIRRIGKPGMRFAINQDGHEPGTAIAVWHDGAWAMVIGRLITGEWARIGNLLVNGKPVHSAWTELHWEGK